MREILFFQSHPVFCLTTAAPPLFQPVALKRKTQGTQFQEQLGQLMQHLGYVHRVQRWQVGGAQRGNHTISTQKQLVYLDPSTDRYLDQVS
jgi:hypothetical protein